MIYKILNYTITIITIVVLSGCGTQKLRTTEYMQVGRGEKALLITNNPEFGDPFDLFFGWIFNEDDEESITIDTVDGVKKEKEFLKENQHVLIEPGLREIGLFCNINFEDKSKLDITDRSIIKMNFEGGYTYETSVAASTSYSCDAKIELEKNLYNKSLKQTD